MTIVWNSVKKINKKNEKPTIACRMKNKLDGYQRKWCNETRINVRIYIKNVGYSPQVYIGKYGTVNVALNAAIKNDIFTLETRTLSVAMNAAIKKITIFPLKYEQNNWSARVTCLGFHILRLNGLWSEDFKNVVGKKCVLTLF